MDADDTLHLQPQPPLSCREIELAIVDLLDEACSRLASLQCRTHHDLLARFRRQIVAGEVESWGELRRWAEPCAIYDTPQDTYCWTEQDLPVQLAVAAETGFGVSCWGDTLLTLIAAHSAGAP